MSTFQIIYAVTFILILLVGCIIKELYPDKYPDGHLFGLLIGLSWPVVLPSIIIIFVGFYSLEFFSKVIAYPFVKLINYFKNKHF